MRLLKKNRGYFQIGERKMFLDILEPIDKELVLNQCYEEEEINILKKLTKNYSAQYFFDIGANNGYYSIIFADLYKSLNIFSFEPNKDAYLKFINTLKVNKNLSDRIILYDYGLSDKKCIQKMRAKIKNGYVQSGGSRIHDNSLISDIITFEGKFQVADENYKIQNSKLIIKIDVEGHELNVLKGMVNIINQNSCILQIEIFDENLYEINKFLNDNKFYKKHEIKKRSNYFYSNF